VIPSLPSRVHHHSTGPSCDPRQACVPLSISSHVHTVPNVLPSSLCGWPRTSLHLLEDGHNHPIVHFAYLCHMIGEVLVCFSFLYINPFELGVEVALNNRSTVTHYKVNLLIFPLRSSSFECTDDASDAAHLLLRHSPLEPLVPICRPFEFKNTSDLQSLIDCEPIQSPAPETIYEERLWIEVVLCLLGFFDTYCHLYILCLFRQIFLAADS